MTRSPLWWKDEPSSWQAQHQSFQESERSRSSPRDIINCHNPSLINKFMKRHCGWRPGYISACFMRWDTARSRTGQRSNCCSGIQSHSLGGWFVTALLAVAARLSARWQRDFSRLSYLSQNKLLQICETNIEKRARHVLIPHFSVFCFNNRNE